MKKKRKIQKGAMDTKRQRKVENCIFWWLAKIKTDASLTRNLKARLQSVMVT